MKYFKIVILKLLVLTIVIQGSVAVMAMELEANQDLVNDVIKEYNYDDEQVILDELVILDDLAITEEYSVEDDSDLLIEDHLLSSSARTVRNGWVRTNGFWYFYANNQRQTNWIRTGGDWFFMNNSGRMQTGWTRVGSDWFFMNNSGRMQTGWTRVGSDWFFMNNSGRMQTGWLQRGQNWYFLANSGRMQTGWLQRGQNWYFLANSGRMQTGWLQRGQNWYFLANSGRMRTGWLQRGTRWYYLNQMSGRMQTGQVLIDGLHLFDSNGRWLERIQVTDNNISTATNIVNIAGEPGLRIVVPQQRTIAVGEAFGFLQNIQVQHVAGNGNVTDIFVRFDQASLSWIFTHNQTSFTLNFEGVMDNLTRGTYPRQVVVRRGNTIVARANQTIIVQ